MRKKHKIQFTHNRVLLSEVLPYETPLFFSNRRFYRFANYYGIKLNENKLIANKHIGDEGLEEFLNILNLSGRINPFTYFINHKTMKWDDIKEDEDYRGYRSLTLIHPIHQIAFVDFYNKYQDLILYYCNRSNFSIRFPDKKAHLFKEQNDSVSKVLDEPDDNDAYENLKHYFSYQKYHNINSFFDDYTYLRAEKKFQFLLKLDMKKCFESIKISTFCLAIYGTNEIEHSGSFTSEFEQLMYIVKGETNGDKNQGIIIGPEFSRIFAEIILQAVDKSIELGLSKNNYILNSDYECYRYVDDVYFFFNESKVQKKFKNLIENELSKYGLSLNPDKEKVIERPLVDIISVAKEKIENLIKDVFENKLNKLSADDINDVLDYKISPYSINYKNVISKFKCIVRETNIEYRDIMTFAASRINFQLDKMLISYDQLYQKYAEAEIRNEIDSEGQKLREMFQKEMLKFLEGLVSCIFFFISSDFRVSTTHTFISILYRIIYFINGYYNVENERIYRFEKMQQNILLKNIHDEIIFIIKNTNIENNQQVELSYIIALDKNLKHNFTVPISLIEKLLSKIEAPNYFTFGSLLFLIGNDRQYETIKKRLITDINLKIKSTINSKSIETESIYLLIDSLCCPFIEYNEKSKFLNSIGIFDEIVINKIVTFAFKQKNLFLKWENINLRKESLAKKSQEVY